MATSVSAAVDGDAVSRSSRSQDRLALLGRVLIAAIFVMSGVGKVAAPAATLAYMKATGLPLAPLGLVVAALIELGGGIALALGYRTRLVGAVLAAFAIVTALIFHSAVSDQNQLIHFFKNVAIAGGLLQVVAFGGGRFSLDARSSR